MIMAPASFLSEDEDSTESRMIPPIPHPDRRERPLVLLVDDDPHDREIYGRILCYNGYDVLCAGDGSSGMQLALEQQPDAVLLDIGLPDLHGLDLCSAIRTNPETTDIPIVALSAYAASRMGEQARLAGCTRYIEKPASPVAVLHEIERLVGMAPLAGIGRPPRMITPGS